MFWVPNTAVCTNSHVMEKMTIYKSKDCFSDLDKFRIFLAFKLQFLVRHVLFRFPTHKFTVHEAYD